MANDSDARDLMNENQRLREALRPFADFGGDPKDWAGTVWETLKETDAVLHNYNSGHEVYLRDFINAKKVLEQ